MDNEIKYLKTEEYTPQQISNPKLNLNFEPIKPVEAISGYRRLYRPEGSSQQSSENPTDSRTESELVQEIVQAEPVSEQQMHTQESKKGKIYTKKREFVEDMREDYNKELTDRGISED